MEILLTLPLIIAIILGVGLIVDYFLDPHARAPMGRKTWEEEYWEERYREWEESLNENKKE